MNAGRRARRLVTARGLVVATAGLALALGPAVAAPAGAASAATSTATSSARWIVRAAPGRSPAVESRIAALGGRVVAAQRGLDTVVADLPAAAAAALQGAPGVIGVSRDAAAKAMSLGFDPATQPGALTNVARITGATAMWQKGYTGAGVDVAVIDTGVAPVPALSDATKVVIGPDLSFESQVPAARYLDTFGHGTAMASIIAGREGPKASGATYAANSRTTFYGMAPDARLVSLKLGDRNGTVDVSQLIAAIDWVVQNKTANGLNIRVLNLSFGTDGTQSNITDPLSWAADVAWRKGLVVVASAGNDGQKDKGLANPAYNRYLVAVGAVDTKGTDTLADDAVPAFSAHEGSSASLRTPDVIAPGVGILGAAAPNSTLGAAFPAARFGNGYLRGSGTSQAAAVVSGAAALLLQHRPSLTNLQVKGILMASATALSGVSSNLQGKGELNLVKAMTTSPTNSWILPQLSNAGTGTLEGARGSMHVSVDGVALTGEKDVLGGTWSASTSASKTSSATTWSSDGTFNGNQWIGGGFATDVTSVAGQTWGGRTWSGRTWSGRTWSGRTWSGLNWSTLAWSGSTWSSADWVSSSGAWAGSLWSSAAWG